MSVAESLRTGQPVDALVPDVRGGEDRAGRRLGQRGRRGAGRRRGRSRGSVPTLNSAASDQPSPSVSAARGFGAGQVLAPVRQPVPVRVLGPVLRPVAVGVDAQGMGPGTELEPVREPVVVRVLGWVLRSVSIAVGPPGVRLRDVLLPVGEPVVVRDPPGRPSRRRRRCRPATGWCGSRWSRTWTGARRDPGPSRWGGDARLRRRWPARWRPRWPARRRRGRRAAARRRRRQAGVRQACAQSGARHAAWVPASWSRDPVRGRTGPAAGTRRTGPDGRADPGRTRLPRVASAYPV